MTSKEFIDVRGERSWLERNGLEFINREKLIQNCS